MLTALVTTYGWAGLGERIALRCFTQEPSIASSLKVLRKTPWARAKVESLYLFMSDFLRQMVTGFVIILAVVLDVYRARLTRGSS